MRYPVGDRLYYRCSLCGELIESIPWVSLGCGCGNLRIDLEAGSLVEKHKGTARLLRRIA
ncbi:MAG: hypothetical protein ACHQ50_05485 [Fimbriimonadales bacterium]